MILILSKSDNKNIADKTYGLVKLIIYIKCYILITIIPLYPTQTPIVLISYYL